MTEQNTIKGSPMVVFAAAGMIFGGTAAVFAEESKPQETRPNIILIISDDHSSNALGIGEDNPLIHYPNFTRFAREGMLFNRSYCCNSICGPSRAAILTGRHSHMNGFVSNEWNRFDGSQPNYAKMLQKAGYQTAYFGKWHLVSDPVGFDTWNVVPGQGDYYNPVFYGNKFQRGRINGYATDVITDMSLDWIENRDKSKPFMMVIGHKAPHRAWVPARRHIGKVDGKKLPIPATLFDDYANRPADVKATEMNILHHMSWSYDLKIKWNMIPKEIQDKLNKMRSGWVGGPTEVARFDAETAEVYHAFYEKRTQELIDGMQPGGKFENNPKALLEFKWRCYMEDYLATIMAVDEGIGQVFDYLDKNNLSENTLVLYCGDQSFYIGEHGWYDKRWCIEESMRMPLLMRWKGKIAPGTECNELVQNIDYAPTFAEVAGIKDTKEYGFQGQSLVPLFANKPVKSWRDALYYAFYEWPAEHNVARHDAIRTDRYTFAYLPRTNEWMLFDDQKDPNQMRNLVNDPEYAETVKELKKLYYQKRQQYQVPDYLPGKDRVKLNGENTIKARW